MTTDRYLVRVTDRNHQVLYERVVFPESDPRTDSLASRFAAAFECAVPHMPGYALAVPEAKVAITRLPAFEAP